MIASEIYKKLREQNGDSAQLVVAVEELSELTKEITKCLRNKGNIDHLAEEVADVERAVPTTTLISNNSIGSVYKEGPYGTNSSNVSVAYILGVHPREKGAHKLMEQALKFLKEIIHHKLEHIILFFFN